MPLRGPAAHPAGTRFSVSIPNFGAFGDFADPRNVATVAAAEQASRDGLFVWDHVLHRQHQGRPSSRGPVDAADHGRAGDLPDPTGTLLTPVPRYRPQQLARQVATLDHLSGGRVVFAAGSGGPIEDEYRSFGDTDEPRLLAERLDEGLELSRRSWSGEAVDHHGRHYEVRDVTLLPATVQQPRPPVWIGGFWPRRPPMRRAARWDGSDGGRVGTATAVPSGRQRHGEIRLSRAAVSIMISRMDF